MTNIDLKSREFGFDQFSTQILPHNVLMPIVSVDFVNDLGLFKTQCMHEAI